MARREDSLAKASTKSVCCEEVEHSASAVLESGVRTYLFRIEADRDRFVHDIQGAMKVEELQ